MKRAILLFFSALAFFSYKGTYGQDPEFTQFYANMLYLNPAFAGSDKCPRVGLSYRNQWPKLGSTYVTYSFAYDQRVDFLEGGLGLLIYQDVQANGALNTFSANGMYSYSITINRYFYIRGGFEVSFLQKHLGDNFIFPDMIDPLYGPIFPTNEEEIEMAYTKNIFDFSAGVLGFTKNHYFGIAVHHLTQPVESFRGNHDAVLPRKFTLHYGTTIPLRARGFRRGELSISPNFLFQQQRDFQQFNYGLYLNRKSIVAGLWIRQNFKFHYDAVMFLIGYIQKKIKFAYSYDLTVSKLRNSTLGAHEISFGYTFNCPKKKRKFRTISCPSF